MTIVGVLVALAALVLLLGVALHRVAARQRHCSGFPPGRLRFADSGEVRGSLLFARTIALRGRPDLLIEDGGMVIPVEVKTGRTPDAPYRGHIMQLLAYCLLVEETHGRRPAHGVLRYPERDFRIAYDARNERELRELVDAILAEKRARREQHRSHRQVRRCAACGYRDRCPERLTDSLPAGE